MAKKTNLALIDDPNINQEETQAEKPKTSKKYIKEAEAIVRKLDNILQKLTDLGHESNELVNTSVMTDVTERDRERFTEMAAVIDASADILYHLTHRMSRKYVGKEIDALDDIKRKPLKKK